MKTLKDIDWDLWEPTERATLLFIIQDERILLIHKKRGLGAGKINGPGGRIDPGETPQECAVREIQEELCITALRAEQAGELSFQFVDGYALHCTVFTATAFEGTPAETDEAIPLWFDVNAIPYDKMWQDDHLWMPLMLEGKTFKGFFVFDGDHMLDYGVDDL